MQLISYIWVLLAAVLWGTTGTAQTYLQGGVSAFTVAMARSAIGGGGLLLFVLVRRQIKWQIINWRWTILAALSIAAFQCLFFTSVRLTGVAVGTVVTIGSAPVFAGIIEAVIWKVRPTRVWMLATLCSIVGAVLLFSSNGETIIDPLGVAIALCAGFLFALYTNVSKRLMESTETLPAVALVFSICALCLLPFSFTNGIHWATSLNNVFIMIYLGVFTCAIAYVLYLGGLKKISSSAAVTLSLGEPLTAALLGVFMIGEYISVLSWFGVALLFSGIVILTVGQSNKVQ